MKFSFELQNDIRSLLPSVKEEIAKNGGELKGDETSGKFRGKGIEGSYAVQEKNATVIITKKPFGFSDAKIKEEILRYFGSK